MGALHTMKALLVPVFLLFAVPEVNALIGYGIEMYNPSCAFACRSATAGFMLDCSDPNAGHGGHSHGSGGPTTPECRAQDTYFLQTLAYCIDEQCAPFNVKASKLEWYWENKATGSLTAIPKWTFAEALASVVEKPTELVGEEGMLNFTAKVDPESWAAEKVSMEYFEWQESLHSRYGLVVLTVGFCLPIFLSWLGYLPYTTRLLEKANALIAYPSIFRDYNIRPLPFSLGYAPTIGQSLYIAFFLLLNLLVTALDYKSVKPNTWFESRREEILAYVANRTGVIAFALLPLVILFSSRNNFLLALTNWSHTTYLLLHRWIAWILVLQTVTHSIVELMIYFPSHATESKQLYWIWGIVGTLAMVIMIPLSLLWVRQRTYEVFLISHILLAIFVIVGCWYHVEFLFTRKWGYEFWIYAACAVWFFERLLRVFRTWKVGIQKTVVKQVTGQIVRVDIPNVRWGLEPGQHAYVSFPSLSWLRPWENHPFSIIPTALLLETTSFPARIGKKASGTESPSENEDIEKTAAAASQTKEIQRADSTSSISSPGRANVVVNTAGVTFFIRKAKGITKYLTANNALTTLLEGPYTSQHTGDLFKTDRLVVFAGGIGITGVFPYLWGSPNGKIYWSVKSENEPLTREFEGALGSSGVEKEVRVGSRFDMRQLVERESEVLGGKGRLGVVVCGPAGMCDDVRAAVVDVGKRGVVVELHVEAFAW